MNADLLDRHAHLRTAHRFSFLTFLLSLIVALNDTNLNIVNQVQGMFVYLESTNTFQKALLLDRYHYNHI